MVSKTKAQASPNVAEVVGVVPGDSSFSGVARSVQAYDNQGFRNFRILTLFIENNVVTKIEYSDPFANFETIARMELSNEMSIHRLNNRWEHGKTLEK